MSVLIGWAEPLGTVFIKLITMVVIPLVVASLFTGVASLGDRRRLGRIGGRTLAYFLVTTLLAAVIGLGVAVLADVGSGLDSATRDAISVRFESTGSGAAANLKSVPGVWQTVLAMVPQNPIAAAAQGDLLALIFAVIVFGAASTALDEARRRPLVSFFSAVNDVCMVIIQSLMRAAPYAVCILIAGTVVHSGLDLLRSLAMYALVVVVALLAHVLLVLAPALRLGARGLVSVRFIEALAMRC